MSGVKHVIVNSLAYISKPLHHMMMAEPREKIEEMLKEKDQEENGKRKLGEMKLSKFGFGFELTGFVAFLGWTGMCLFSLLGLVGSALITVPIDIPNLFRGSGIGINWEFVVALMQGFGSAFLLIAFGFFLMNYLLRKKNKENDFQGVKKMLTVICSISIVITIIVYSVLLICSMYEILIGTLIAPRHFSSLILFPALIIQCLLLHGIKAERSGFIKAFLIFHYTLFVFFIAGLAIVSIGCAFYYGMFIVVLCGLLYIMILTFIFVFNIGFYVVLHSFYLEKEKSQQQMKKNIEFVNMSFEK